MLAECLAGLAAGLVARYFIPDSLGIGADTLLGILGGGTAAFIYKLFGHRLSVDDFNVWSVSIAVAGAFVLIAISRSAAGRRTIAP